MQAEPDAGPAGDDRPSEIHLSQTFGGRWALSGDLTAEDGATLASGIGPDDRRPVPRRCRRSRRRAAHAEPTSRPSDRGDLPPRGHRRSSSSPAPTRSSWPWSTTTSSWHRLRAGGHGRPRMSPAGSSASPRHLNAMVEITSRLKRALRARCRRDRSPTSDGSDPPEDGCRSSTGSGACAAAPLSRPRPVGPYRSQPRRPRRTERVSVPTPTVERLRVCEIDGAGPVPTATIQRLACDGTIRRVIVDAQSEVLDVGRARRLATPTHRAALRVRDRGCAFPGCDRPPEWCQAHHLIPFEHGGATDLGNLCLLCSHHHHLVHEGGWSLERIGVVWVAISPTGDRRTQARRQPDEVPAHTARARRARRLATPAPHNYRTPGARTGRSSGRDAPSLDRADAPRLGSRADGPAGRIGPRTRASRQWNGNACWWRALGSGPDRIGQ